jgi:PIN domain nuclease of toxin-antitoxin system
MMGMSEGILIDTHVWVWMSEDLRQIGPAPYERIGVAAKNASLYLSSISLYEIANLVHRLRLTLSLPLADWFSFNLASHFIKTLPLSAEVAATIATLPPDFHRDPMDRIIAATAVHHSLTLCTHDTKLIRSGRNGIYNLLEI